jgi:hypothetical protein
LPVARNDRVVVVVRELRAYPTGFEITVEGHLRFGEQPPEDALELSGDRDLDLTDSTGVGRDRFDGPRFGVRFSDGRATVLGDASGARNAGPMMIVRFSERSRGGPDDGDDVRMSLWVWPLPPPGVVQLTCTWVMGGSDGPPLGIDLDGDAIRAAARRAEPYWLS